MGASAAGAQPPAEPSPLIESIEVRVVNVEVTVTDPDGYPVTGLTRDDFLLYEDGVEQPISNFYSVESNRVRTSAEEQWRTVEDRSPFRRRMVLMVDNNTLSKPERAKALEALQRFVDEKFDGTYEWSVVAVGDEVRVLQPLTRDKYRVRAAIDRIRLMPTNTLRYEGDRLVLNDPVRVRAAQREAAALSESTVGTANDRFTRSLRFESQVTMERNLQATRRTVEGMIQAFQAYANLDGKKILVLVTGGIQMLPEYGYQASGEGGPDRGSAQPPVEDTKLLQLYQDLRETLAAAGRAANAAGFTIYPLKATGIEIANPQLDVGYRSSGATFNPGAFSAAPEVDDADSGQRMLSDATGGLYLTSNRIRESIERIDTDTQAFYSLGFVPAHAADSAFHPLRVEVKDPRVRVRARPGYVDLTDEERLTLYLASPLTFAKDKGTLPVRMEIDRDANDSLVATAILPIASVNFFEREGAYVGRVYLYLTIYDDSGRQVSLIRRSKDLTFPPEREQEARGQELRYGLKFELDKKGRYTVTMTLRDEISGEIGTAVAEVSL